MDGKGQIVRKKSSYHQPFSQYVQMIPHVNLEAGVSMDHVSAKRQPLSWTPLSIVPCLNKLLKLAGRVHVVKNQSLPILVQFIHPFAKIMPVVLVMILKIPLDFSATVTGSCRTLNFNILEVDVKQ